MLSEAITEHSMGVNESQLYERAMGSVVHSVNDSMELFYKLEVEHTKTASFLHL